MMDDLTRQVNLIVESLLENESLTSDLHDSAAQVLLNWGIALTERIVHRVVGLSNLEAEQVMYQQLRATRGLMRYINRWVPSRHDISAEKSLSQLERIRQQAATIYTDETLPDQAQLTLFIEQSLTYSPEETITELRRLFEEPSSASLNDDSMPDDFLQSEQPQKEEAVIASSEEGQLSKHDESFSESEKSEQPAIINNYYNGFYFAPQKSPDDTEGNQQEAFEKDSARSRDEVELDQVKIHLFEEGPTTEPVSYQYPILYKEPKSTGLWGVVMNVIHSMTLAYRKLFSLEAHL